MPGFYVSLIILRIIRFSTQDTRQLFCFGGGGYGWLCRTMIDSYYTAFVI